MEQSVEHDYTFSTQNWLTGTKTAVGRRWWQQKKMQIRVNWYPELTGAPTTGWRMAWRAVPRSCRKRFCSCSPYFLLQLQLHGFFLAVLSFDGCWSVVESRRKNSALKLAVRVCKRRLQPAASSQGRCCMQRMCLIIETSSSITMVWGNIIKASVSHHWVHCLCCD